MKETSDETIVTGYQATIFKQKKVVAAFVQ